MKAALSLVLITLISVPVWSAATDDLEPRLKAEFVDRFIRFVEWPEKLPTSGPFIIGVFGRSPVQSHLAEIAEQRLIKGKVAAVRRVSTVDDVAACHVVFISADARASLDQILERTSGRPILTVGDGDGYGAEGVLINLYRDGKYLRFEINRGAVRRSGLKFSSQLLRLARLIGEE